MCAWQLKSVPLLSDYFRKWLRLPDKYSDADFYRAWHDAGGPVPGKTYRFAGKGSVGKLQDRFGKLGFLVQQELLGLAQANVEHADLHILR